MKTKSNQPLFLLLLITFTFASCNKETSENVTTNNLDTTTTKAEYEFLNQNLQGKIGGKDWEFKSGEARFGTNSNWTLDTTERWVYMYADTLSDPCYGYDNATKDYIMFTFPADTGLYKLGWDSDEVTITLYEIATQNNHIISQGAFEILSEDSTTITGRMDAHTDDGENSVNGNFTLKKCN